MVNSLLPRGGDSPLPARRYRSLPRDHHLNGLLCESVKTAVCVHVFDGDGDDDMDDDDEALIDSASNDMYRRHPLLISESHFGNPFTWTGQPYGAVSNISHWAILPVTQLNWLMDY
jgi:hypothetical protein